MPFPTGSCKNIDMYVKSHDTALSKTKNHEKSFEEWINYTSLKSIIYYTHWNVAYWSLKIIYSFSDDCLVI